MSKVSVLHLIDTLEAGGAERVAVNLANLLPRDRYAACLCTSRREGPLSNLVAEDVRWLKLHRTYHFDLKAFIDLLNFIRDNNVRIIHAHSSSLFIAAEVKLFLPDVKVLWHVHAGALESGIPLLYKLAIRNINGIITVNEPLAFRIIQDIKVPNDSVWYLKNFSVQGSLNGNQSQCLEFSGKPGKKIICVSNFRAEKDHLTLVKAFSKVVTKEPEARLFLVGLKVDEDYYQELLGLISELDLSQQVVVLGQRNDVQQILNCFDIGVLSSQSEGLPLSLLEYGQAKLAVVVTNVGQCREVVDNGQAGLVVAPRDVAGLAAAMIEILEDIPFQQKLGEALFQRVNDQYSARAAIERIDKIYMKLLNK